MKRARAPRGPRDRKGAPAPLEDVRARAFALRTRGATYALIEKRLAIPYLQAREFGRAYDAQHGKPAQVVRTLAEGTAGSEPIRIPVRDLRNDSAAILRQVEAGQRFMITVSGRPVAELGPAVSRATFAPGPMIDRILREAPLDAQFTADIHAAVGQRIDRL